MSECSHESNESCQSNEMISFHVKAQMTFHYEILECCHFKILMISVSPGDNYGDKLDGY